MCKITSNLNKFRIEIIQLARALRGGGVRASDWLFKGRRFESQLRRFFTPTPAESLPNLNPAFLLSASRPFNWWPSVWFGSMLCGISMQPKYPGN